MLSLVFWYRLREFILCATTIEAIFFVIQFLRRTETSAESTTSSRRRFQLLINANRR